MRRVALICLAMLLCAPAAAEECPEISEFSGLPVPRFVVLEAREANGRAGPSTEHPILWSYRRAGLPLQVIGETRGWRQVRDPDGAEVWMVERFLGERRAVRTLQATALRTRAETEAALIAEVERGAILSLERCRQGWCRLEADGARGWVPAEALWGLTQAERGTLEGGRTACYPTASTLSASDAG